MALYPFESQLVVDADGDHLILNSASVAIYDPSDTAMGNPLALVDANGVQLPNPLQASPQGFLPAFQATVPQVMWNGGGFSGYINSFKGVLDQATAASTSAANSAGEAAASRSAAESAQQAAEAAQAAAEQAAAGSGGSGTGGDPYVIYAASTSEADVRAAINQALSTKVSGVATKIVQLPAGTINIASPNLINSPTTGTSDQIFGLTIRGHGERVTTINFTNTGAASSDPRNNNLFTLANRVRNFTLEGIKFISSNPANNMAWFWSVTKTDANSIYPQYGSGQNQRMLLKNVEWGGKWNRVIGIDGDVNTNNNSEWLMRDCATDTTVQYTDAFLRCGGISGTFSGQNQYLNFNIDNCNMTTLSGTVFRWDKGGSIRINGGSWSAASNANAITWFKMPNAADESAMRLSVRDVRFEPKAANQLIIDCAWGNGHVVFDHCTDISSLQNSTSATYTLHRYTAVNNRLPLVVYRDCTLIGGHQTTSFYNGRGKMIYEHCDFYGYNNGFTKAVATSTADTDAFLRYPSGYKPSYTFRDCEWAADDMYQA